MDLSKIKKIVLEEGKVIIVDNDDALVIMSFDEYKKIKNLPKQDNQEPKVIPADVEQKETKDTPEAPEKVNSELTLDDLPF